MLDGSVGTEDDVFLSLLGLRNPVARGRREQPDACAALANVGLECPVGPRLDFRDPLAHRSAIRVHLNLDSDSLDRLARPLRPDRPCEAVGCLCPGRRRPLAQCLLRNSLRYRGSLVLSVLPRGQKMKGRIAGANDKGQHDRSGSQPEEKIDRITPRASIAAVLPVTMPEAIPSVERISDVGTEVIGT